MARRKSGIQQFLEGFNGVYGTSIGLMKDIDTSKAATAKVETTTGEDGKTSYSLLGKTYDHEPTESEQNFVRNTAMATAEKTFGDAGRGMTLGNLANQQKTADDEQQFKAKTQDWFKNSRRGQATADYQSQMGEWQKADKSYKDQIAAGQDPAALGLPPAKPEQPTLSYLDTLNDTASYLALKAESGKPDPQAWMSLGKALDDVKKEGTIEALRALQSGDKDGAIAAFNESGKAKIDPASVVGFNPVKVTVAGTPMDTYEMKVKKPDGSIQTINAFKQLDAYGKTNELFNRVMKVRDDTRADASAGRADAAAGRAATTFSQEQTDRATTLGEKSAKVTAGLALFQEKNPNATQAEIEAVRAGILKPVAGDEKKDYKPITADIRAALSDKAVDEKGNPKGDLMTGREIENRNLGREKELSDFMADRGITDANKGLIEFNKTKRAAEKKTQDALIKKVPDTEQDAHAAAADAVKQGASLDEINKRLKAKGYRPLRAKSAS